MSAIAAKPAGNAGAFQPVASVIAIILAVIFIGAAYFLGSSGYLAGGAMLPVTTLVGIIVGAALIAFGVHFVPVGGAPAAMGQSPGIATGVAMLATGAGLAGLFGGAWAASLGFGVALAGGAIGGGLMMAITCLMVNISYVYGMGIPAASGKVAKDPITGDSQAEYKSQGTEGHGLPFISYVGGVIGGLFGGLGGTLIYIELLEFYNASFSAANMEDFSSLAVGLAGIFAIGMFLVIAVLSAYNITGTIEGPHDPKFKRFPRAIIAAICASGICGLVALLAVAIL
ncbi:tetrahydromethanopterin S-methyltransferase subunit D [Methanocorpusculum vombati]|uniref:Tetrahydromethanopterin S-methyltransferase subunit D n=1 Tax=Methanocorpusculum vombati TaxID=3002864 RepID=A0ABT4IMS9_9EURY|nr:tetrahydromethanopterin S-methyltransferase subunit D [Methanocorpusculum vombati]MCZ9318854.1 tetrahydromethanopterin S-methyltransferase subunit D [Methanocorpusculum sp.]MCZ0863047.1 tetrahydromethanopterin S-methyltransferase subunit D [Methanocorpusculum vombati]MDE2520270.1 tetrahydromethanopterin S-methyltransferase subunit D [Methanocorpusculum sp.]MDE2534619.1 tetrahydromethanopterin S-methyltransferase subunit D [Methanocorpusculum sp.]MDE2545437.1 tetrahydromethanopterin S-methyl